MTNLNSVKSWASAPLLSPKGNIVRPIGIAIIFGICHLFGWREHTSFLSGTSASPETSLTVSAVLGVTYIASYLGFVILAPILLIAAGIQKMFDSFRSKRC